MSNAHQNDPETQRTVEDFKRMLQRKSRQERAELLRQAQDEALAEELEEEREINEREAEALRETLTQTNPREQAIFARDQAKSAALLLLMLFLILWLIAAATGRTDILRFPGAPPPPTPLQPILERTSIPVAGARVPEVDMNPGPVGPPPPVGVAFTNFYYKDHDGPRLFGKPISVEYGPVGQRYQWFQRALLKEFPQFAGSGWDIQGDLLGVAATKGIPFPTQMAFISTDSARFFQETNHGLRGKFLDFWNRNDGLLILGMPISEEVLETLNNQQYTVQYFERGRLELHPENAGTPDEVQIGLLGQEIKTNPDWPRKILAAQPTPMPLPTPTAVPAAVVR